MKFGIKEIIFLVLLLSIPLANWALVIRPGEKRRDAMLEQIGKKQTKLSQIRAAAADRKAMQEQVASLQEAVVYFHSKMPHEKEMDKVLNEVALMAQENHLTSKSIRQVQKNNADNVFNLSEDMTQSEQPIDVQLEGNFLGFYTFLQALENQPRIMRVSRMTLRKSSDGPEGMMTAAFNVSIFFERADSKSKAASARRKG